VSEFFEPSRTVKVSKFKFCFGAVAKVILIAGSALVVAENGGRDAAAAALFHLRFSICREKMLLLRAQGLFFVRSTLRRDGRLDDKVPYLSS
jgi:hypothetical protein